jgi:decaprenyl-phosphate phosphoribosyltransferase
MGQRGITAGIPAPARQDAPRARALAPLRASRPGQWPKNLLVAAAPLAAGQLLHAPVLAQTAAAFLLFSAAAAAGYLVNDVVDLSSDRQHPVKRTRPIAAGDLSVAAAITYAVALASVAVAGAALISLPLAATIATYLAVTVGYSLGLKHEPVIDLALVASGFLLRAIAGGAASDIPLSRWFLIVAGFGSLFLVAGKRYSELVTHGDDAGTRASLAAYSPSYLRFVWGTAAAVTIAAYCLWAFEVGTSFWGPLSVVPFVLGILRAGLDVDRGLAEQPERMVRDRVMVALAGAWLLAFAAGVSFGAA